jgi:hypothetical protein
MVKKNRSGSKNLAFTGLDPGPGPKIVFLSGPGPQKCGFAALYLT